jgi:hypothetical protein
VECMMIGIRQNNMKIHNGETFWKIGQRVKYMLPFGDRICFIVKTTPYNEKNKSHYVELMDEKTGEHIFSAHDSNLVNLETGLPYAIL